MTTFATEYFAGDSMTVDGNGIHRGQRQFTVTYSGDSSDPSNPIDAIGIPAVGSPHPRYPKAYCDSLSAAPTASSYDFRVTANYSSDGAFAFVPRLDESKPTLRTTESSFVKQELVVPSLVRIPTPYAIGPGGQTVGAGYRYERQDFRIPIWFENVRVRLRRDSYGPSDRAAISNQVGKFHYLDKSSTQVFQFVGVTVSQIQDSLYEYVYEWIRDPGNGGFPTGTFARYAPEFRRLPFEVYQIKPFVLDSSGSETSPPEVVSFLMYTDEDLTKYAGAHSLPGSPW